MDTPGVASAYGDQAKYLQPMRDLWQGSEGICWLGVVDGSELEGGAYYLDRTPQVKHIAGTTVTAPYMALYGPSRCHSDPAYTFSLPCHLHAHLQACAAW